MNTRWRPWLALLVGFCAGSLTRWVYLLRDPHVSTRQLLADARQALRKEDYPSAERLARRALRQTASSTAAFLIAGEACAKLNRLDDAMAYYGRVPDTHGDMAFRAMTAKADLLFQLGRFSESETTLRRSLELNPQNPLVLTRLVDVLGATGRQWESRPYLFHLVRLGHFSAEALFQLVDYARWVDVEPLVEKALKAVPGDPNPLLARARVQLHANKGIEARQILWQVVGARPGNLDAQALLGEVLVDLHRDEEFHKWRQQLPPEADGHPDIWYVRGFWSEKSGQLEAAARCYWEAIRIEPDQSRANSRIASVLKELARPAESEPFMRRAALLMELNDLVSTVYAGPNAKIEYASRMARLTEALGRIWEVQAWNTLLARQGDKSAAAAQDRLNKVLEKQHPPQTLSSDNPALAIDLSRYPFPDWSRRRKAESPNDTGRASPALAKVDARFVDSTHEAGIDFSYVTGDDPQTKGMRYYQTFGGGVAVLDYDGNGWPDLHFTQGADQPFDDADTSHVDRLYRNLGNGRFVDVTFSAGVPEHRYSQGATVGDYDNDGFPDLFVSNIGKSRLYRNNGDGTFADVTLSAGITLDHYSASSLLADLNGDALPDIFDVVNLRDRKALDAFCDVANARVGCTQSNLDGDVDRLLLNLGDGTFRDVTDASGLADIKGKGLGLVAADFDRSGRLSLFIANDIEANFYLVNQTPQRGALPRFLERGVLHGLAFDRDGAPQGNMGIAADDCNGDGLLDLYVTTFYEEAKTLRSQQSEQMFVDVTREANLRDGGFQMLGFGTQFLDAELDGLPDLVVTNGHVLDATSIGVPFEMPPQYFRNVGNGRFIEKSAESLGPFFKGKYLGRGLARLDWNRDGREDFAVSHIHSPAALVTNQTVGAGHYLAVRLVAVNSARDAIGVIATLTAGDFTRVRELTAGDGYLASNQRELVFGLGTREKIDKLVVRWPSGGEQEFTTVQVDGEYLVIENRETPVALRIDR